MKARIEEIAIGEYRSSGHGLTYSDIQEEYSIEKKQAQRSLKHFHARKIHFTSMDLTRQGIDLLKNRNPQEFFPTCIKAEIIENLERRKHIHRDTHPLSTSILSQNARALQFRRAQTFLEMLLVLPYAPPYIHKLQLLLTISNTDDGKLLLRHDGRRKRSHEEVIGRRYVKYLVSGNGTIEIFVRSNDSPFRIETHEDESLFFTFLGQVRDRLLYHVGDVRESHIPSVMDWILVQCDLNKDVEIDEKAQMTLPDIQLKYAGRVFREYVKIMQGKAYYRIEESLKLKEVLPVALDNIRKPFSSIENKIDDLKRSIESLKKAIDMQNDRYPDLKLEKQSNVEGLVVDGGT